MTINLIDLLDRATIEPAAQDHVAIHSMDCGGEPRTALFQHPDSIVEFPVAPERGARLRTSAGIKRLAWEHCGSPVHFRIGVRRRDTITWIWERALDPRSNPADRGWIEASIALPRASAVLLSTRADASEHCWSGWADPVVEPRRPRRPRRRRPAVPPAPHLLLLTADALRADHVSTRAAHTPNLDTLAARGLSFEHTRTASLCTPASYSTMLSGLHSGRHGFLSEWGSLDPDLAILPRTLARAGYATVFAPSELQTSRPEQGFAPAFERTLPALGNPSQDGAITARAILEALSTGDGRPTFVWGQFFDCHPPRRLPDERVARYYEGDPRDPQRRWEPERVAAIRGSESVLYIDAALPHLHAGRPEHHLTVRLRDTARALLGEIPDGPDTAQHLQAMGLDDDALPGWLLEQVALLARGEVPSALVTWLEDLRPRLAVVEAEVLAWLEGVVDYRWPLAQVHAGAEHFDAHVGALLAGLDELGLSEHTTVVVTSPHGENFGEGGHHFTHHQPWEVTLRVPLIMRGAGESLPRGTAGGVMELLDLAPTLLELLGAPAPGGLDGTSRLADIRARRDLPPRTSFALLPDLAGAVAMRDDRKLVHRLSEIPRERKDENLWLDPVNGDAPCDPDRELEAELMEWITSNDLPNLVKSAYL